MAAPYTQNLSPASGTEITASQPISVEVLAVSPTTLVRVLIAIEFPGLNLTELVYDGTGTGYGYRNAYAANSTVEAITSGADAGYRYTFIRDPIWPDSPKLRIYAFNDAGEEL